LRCAGRFESVALIRAKEEQLILDDWSANCAAKLVKAERWFESTAGDGVDSGLVQKILVGIQRVIVTTMQAISGAGYPGVPSMDINANVVPFIGGEEEKMQQETQKIMGTLRGDHVEPLAAKVSAHCNRVPVVDGHTVTVSVEFSGKPSEADMLRAFGTFRSLPQERELPSAPRFPVQYMPEADRPQPRKDAERERGMATFIGRLRACPVFDYKFVALGHNTIRGAAGAAVLNAELMHSEGMLD